MKIAVTAKGPDLDSEMDPRFGRAKYILVLDPDGSLDEVIDNSESGEAMGGAGMQTAKLLADRKVDILLTGRCGPNALRGLSAAGIRVVANHTDKVREAVERFTRSEVTIARIDPPGDGGGRGSRSGRRGAGNFF
jgi:predicted Fe-Mo cluster-binding NifX family protein